MFIYIMINNNLHNPYAINEIYASRPLRNESSSLTANSMPTKNRIVTETGVPKRALNNEDPYIITKDHIDNYFNLIFKGNKKYA